MSKADAKAYQHEQTAKAATTEAAALKAQIDSIKKDPWAYMSGEGITPDMLLERAAVGKAAPSEEVLQLRQELGEMKTWREQVTQQAEASQRQAQVGSMAAQARKMVQASQDPDALGFLGIMDAIAEGEADFSGQIHAYQEQAKQSGQALTSDQAGAMLRGALSERGKAFKASPAFRKSVLAFLGVPDPSATDQPAITAGQPAKTGQTLTSGMAQGGTGGAAPDLSTMTEAQQRAYFKAKYPDLQ
jgi:hypothetical protein